MKQKSVTCCKTGSFLNQEVNFDLFITGQVVSRKTSTPQQENTKRYLQPVSVRISFYTCSSLVS